MYKVSLPKTRIRGKHDMVGPQAGLFTPTPETFCWLVAWEGFADGRVENLEDEPPLDHDGRDEPGGPVEPPRSNDRMKRHGYQR